MEFGSAFPADGEAFELVEQGEGLLDDVTEFAQALDVRGALARDDGQDPPLARLSAVEAGVVPLSPRSESGRRRGRPGRPGHGRDAIDQGEGLGEEFLGHFERRKVSIGTCGRAFGTSCIHEHACIRCPMLRPGPAQRPRLVEIIDNLNARIAEAEREGWLGEVEGLQVSLAGAKAKLAQIDQRTTVPLGMPDLSQVTGRTVTTGRTQSPACN